MKAANKQMCICNDGLVEPDYHVHIARMDLQNHDLDHLDICYCLKCNSAWQEA